MTHRPARRRATLLVLCAVSALLVSACSSGTSSASGTPAAKSAVAQSAQVRMSGGYVMNEDGTLQQPATNATVPKLNSAALQFTPDGAELAARHFLALTEYAWATGDTQPMKNFFTPDCDPCQTMAADIDALYTSGGWTTGLEYRVISTKKVQSISDTSEANSTYGVLLEVEDAGGATYEDGKLTSSLPISETVGMFVRWTGDSWLVTGLATQQAEAQ